MLRIAPIAALVGALALGACAVAPPTGPSVMVLPAKGKSFADFQQDDVTCRQYAAQQIGIGSPAAAANQSFANSLTLGTVLGAAAGAAIGAATGNPAAGAAIGAGSGLFLGGATGANAAGISAVSLQRRYDMGYLQCMSAKGESVPSVTGGAAPLGFSYPSYYPYPYPYWPYAYPPFPAYYPPAFFGPSFVSIGFGGRFHGRFHGRGHGHFR